MTVLDLMHCLVKKRTCPNINAVNMPPICLPTAKGEAHLCIVVMLYVIYYITCDICTSMRFMGARRNINRD